jgi:hypothetical protein
LIAGNGFLKQSKVEMTGIGRKGRFRGGKIYDNRHVEPVSAFKCPEPAPYVFNFLLYGFPCGDVRAGQLSNGFTAVGCASAIDPAPEFFEILSDSRQD